MAAPEKIYLQPLENNEIYNHWYTLKLNNDFIEYTRTDAFIEKACEFMCNNIDKQLTIYHNSTWRKRDEFIEAFRQFMKGE